MDTFVLAIDLPWIFAPGLRLLRCSPYVKADALGSNAELRIVGKEKIETYSLADRDRRSEVDRIKRSDDGREGLTCPLQDTLI